ncbi:MAG: NUDIX hydrolase [Sandaracinaceae bacterium]|nr:NUDIX hydrolase [Sandaracinaceae bacterium]
MTTRILLDSRKFRVEAVEVPDREGRTRTREVVRHPGAVVILPLLPDGRVLLIRNRRFAVNATLYELPAGTREPGEADDVGALRELEEETGYQAATLSPLVRFFASPGFCDEEMIGFVASDLTPARSAWTPPSTSRSSPWTSPRSARCCVTGASWTGRRWPVDSTG